MEKDNKDLVMKVESLNQIKISQDQALKSHSMIIKLRDSIIQQLKNKIESGKSLLMNQKFEGNQLEDIFKWENEKKLLLDEINELKQRQENNSEKKILEKENQILRSQMEHLKKYKSEYDNYQERKRYQQRYIGLLTKQWFDSQKENFYLKNQLRTLLPSNNKKNINLNFLSNKENIQQNLSTESFNNHITKLNRVSLFFFSLF